MKTTIKFHKAHEMGSRTLETMWHIYEQYYNYSHDYFLSRFQKNTHVALFYQNKKLVGFSGLRVARIKQNGKKKLFINFGQAVMDKKYRGKSILRLLGIRIGVWFFWDLLFSEGYCWIDAISFKSYLFYANSMAEYYPSRKNEMTAQAKSIIDHIGHIYYGAAYCAGKGTVKKEVNFVKDETARITPRHLSSPDIKYYAEANPGYKKGDGLITIVPMSLNNLTHIISGFFKKKKRRIMRQVLSWSPIAINSEGLHRKYA